MAKPKPNAGREPLSKRTHTALSTGLEMDNSHEAGHKAALPRGMLLMLPLECNSADEQY
jgi:hypothetical protein